MGYSYKLVVKLDKMKLDYLILIVKRGNIFYFDLKYIEEKDICLLFGMVLFGIFVEKEFNLELLEDFEVEN